MHPIHLLNCHFVALCFLGSRSNRKMESAEILRTKTVVVAAVVDLCCSYLGLCCKLTWRDSMSI
jgi:hypothetical protein